jgi:hypothetical protein
MLIKNQNIAQRCQVNYHSIRSGVALFGVLWYYIKLMSSAKMYELLLAASQLVDPIASPNHNLFESGYEFREVELTGEVYVAEYDPVVMDIDPEDTIKTEHLNDWLFKIAAIHGIKTNKKEVERLAILVKLEFHERSHNLGEQ